MTAETAGVTREELKAARQRFGLSLTQAAGALGYSRAHYVKLENGRYTVKMRRSLVHHAFADEAKRRRSGRQGKGES